MSESKRTRHRWVSGGLGIVACARCPVRFHWAQLGRRGGHVRMVSYNGGPFRRVPTPACDPIIGAAIRKATGGEP